MSANRIRYEEAETFCVAIHAIIDVMIERGFIVQCNEDDENRFGWIVVSEMRNGKKYEVLEYDQILSGCK